MAGRESRSEVSLVPWPWWPASCKSKARDEDVASTAQTGP
jgi:hypothetical protein